jgi:hypothetical protein
MAPPERRRAVAEKGKSIATIGQVTSRVAAVRATHKAGLQQTAPMGYSRTHDGI